MYSVDTSAILDGWIRYYPPDVFGTVWTRLAELAGVGKLFASDEVMSELEKKDEGAWNWAKQHLSLVPIDTLSRLPWLIFSRSISDWSTLGRTGHKQTRL